MGHVVHVGGMPGRTQLMRVSAIRRRARRVSAMTSRRKESRRDGLWCFHCLSALARDESMDLREIMEGCNLPLTAWCCCWRGLQLDRGSP